MDEFTGSGQPLTQDGFDDVLARLGAAREILWALLAVETSGCGYLPDRRPKLLFERHYFHRLTGARFDESAPDVSAPSAGGYGASGANQYLRLQVAMALDRQAALQSASWGLGQIMGANHAAAGYGAVEDMVSAFVESEDHQLSGLGAFVIASNLQGALNQKDWRTFAGGYNGPSYAKNNYDGQLALFCGQFTTHGCPDLHVRAAQARLTYSGDQPGGVDGFMGPQTQQAIARFQARAHLAGDGQLTDETFLALSQMGQ